ncbi:MAG: hypothetical protein H8E25_04275 [Planctomycetes bacterium]|nr:hypothetical protein [Planctomycetota bacterium]
MSVLRFDGGDYMDVVHNSALGMLRNAGGGTLFAVARTSNTGSQRVLMISAADSGKTRAGINFFDRFGTSIAGNGDFGLSGRRNDADNFQRIEGGVVTLNQFAQWTGVFDWTAGALSLYVNGTLETATNNFQTAGNTSNTDSGNIRVGADAVFGSTRGTFVGDLCEVVVYDRALSNNERAQIESWLDRKWNGFLLWQPLLTAGQASTLSVSGCGAGDAVWFALSLNGAGPITTSWGTAWLTPPVQSVGPYSAAANGIVAQSFPIPASLTGRSAWLQALRVDANGNGELSNPAVVVVQ